MYSRRLYKCYPQPRKHSGITSLQYISAEKVNNLAYLFLVRTCLIISLALLYLHICCKQIECLSEKELDQNDMYILTKLYWSQTAIIKTKVGNIVVEMEDKLEL